MRLPARSLSFTAENEALRERVNKLEQELAVYRCSRDEVFADRVLGALDILRGIEVR